MVGRYVFVYEVMTNKGMYMYMMVQNWTTSPKQILHVPGPSWGTVKKWTGELVDGSETEMKGVTKVVEKATVFRVDGLEPYVTVVVKV